MRWRWGVVVVALAARVEGQEVADPEVAEVPEAAPTVSAALGRAVAERFVACAGSEGAALTDDDRALIGDSVAPLGASVARALGAEGCAGAEAEARCVEAVRAASCDALAQALTAAPGAGGAPPAWAEGHARTLVDRIGRCLAEERGGAATDEELAALGGLRSSLASTLGALVTSGRCSLDENALASCALSVPALSCEALSARLADDPGALGGGVTPECGRFLRCGGGDGDGGAEEADDASVEAMGER
jgi:hypothetical protein